MLERFRKLTFIPSFPFSSYFLFPPSFRFVQAYYGMYNYSELGLK